MRGATRVAETGSGQEELEEAGEFLDLIMLGHLTDPLSCML